MCKCVCPWVWEKGYLIIRFVEKYSYMFQAIHHSPSICKRNWILPRKKKKIQWYHADILVVAVVGNEQSASLALAAASCLTTWYCMFASEWWQPSSPSHGESVHEFILKKSKLSFKCFGPSLQTWIVFFSCTGFRTTFRPVWINADAKENPEERRHPANLNGFQLILILETLTGYDQIYRFNLWTKCSLKHKPGPLFFNQWDKFVFGTCIMQLPLYQYDCCAWFSNSGVKPNCLSLVWVHCSLI